MPGQSADSNGSADPALSVGRDMENHMQYELMYIVPTSFTDEDVSRIEGNIKALIEKHSASMLETKRLGKFRFAYPIKNQRHGTYILVQFESEPQNLAKLDEGLRISNEVLRHLIVRADEAGGSKFDIVQFTEVNIDNKEDKPRRRKEDKDEKEKVSEDKAGVAALEKPEAVADAPIVLSEEELDKKLNAALEGDAKEA